MGGLERFRKEIEILANQITKKFKGLLGIVGVDIVRPKINGWYWRSIQDSQVHIVKLKTPMILKL